MLKSTLGIAIAFHCVLLHMQIIKGKVLLILKGR